MLIRGSRILVGFTLFGATAWERLIRDVACHEARTDGSEPNYCEVRVLRIQCGERSGSHETDASCGETCASVFQKLESGTPLDVVLHASIVDTTCLSAELQNVKKVHPGEEDQHGLVWSCGERMLDQSLQGLRFNFMSGMQPWEPAALIDSWLRCDGLELKYTVLQYGDGPDDKSVLCAPAECVDKMGNVTMMWPELMPTAPSRKLALHTLPRPFDFLQQGPGSIWEAVSRSIPFRSMIGKWIMQWALREDVPYYLEEGQDLFGRFNELSMEDICCAHYEGNCWLGGSDDGKVVIEPEAPPKDYAECCFAFIKSLDHLPEPTWLSAELARAGAAFRAGSLVSRQAIAVTEAEAFASGHALCRFEVRNGEVHSCADSVFQGPGQGHLRALLGTIRILHQHLPLPEGLTFLVNSFDAEWREFPSPVFVRCALKGLQSSILLPSEFQTAWNYVFFLTKTLATFRTVAFNKREPVAFWRGSTTEVAPGGADPSSAGGEIIPANWTWENIHEWARFRLVTLSTLYPHLLDARFTSLGPQVPPDIVNWLMRGSYCCAPYAETKVFRGYKYLINIDATVGIADRLHWYMLTGSLVLQQESNFTLWLLDTAFRAGEHFLIFDRPLRRLLDQIEWAVAHEVEAESMAEAAYQVAMETMSTESVFLYLHRLLRLYAENFDFESTIEDA